MTREEFTAKFNAILANPTDVAAATSFRDEALADYDNANTLTTTLATANENIKKLTDENNNLKEVNYKMFLNGFDKSKSKETETKKEEETDTKEESTTVSIDDVLNGLLGKE